MGDERSSHSGLYKQAEPFTSTERPHCVHNSLNGKRAIIQLSETNVNYLQVHQQERYLRRLSWWSSGWDFAFQCRGCGFQPWSGSYDPTCLRAKKQQAKHIKKKKQKQYCNKFNKDLKKIFKESISELETKKLNIFLSISVNFFVNTVTGLKNKGSRK